jgi:CBS domain-containing protein
MQIKDVMTRRVIALKPDDTLSHAISVFARNRITGAPVVDGKGRVVGILTEMDLLKRLEIGTIEFTYSPVPGAVGVLASEAEGKLRLKTFNEALKGMEHLTVSNVMTSPVITVFPDDKVEEKVTLVIHKRIRRLPVVDKSGVLVGIVSRKDLIKMLARRRKRAG